MTLLPRIKSQFDRAVDVVVAGGANGRIADAHKCVGKETAARALLDELAFQRALRDMDTSDGYIEEMKREVADFVLSLES